MVSEKKNKKDKTLAHIPQLQEYFYCRGRILQELGQLKEAYLSYATVLKIPDRRYLDSIPQVISRSLGKLLIIEKILKQRDPVEFKNRPVLHLCSHLNFLSVGFLQSVKAEVTPWLQILNVLGNKPESKAAPRYQEQSQEADQDMEINHSAPKESLDIPKIDQVLSLFANDVFVPNGDLPLIQQLSEEKDLMALLNELSSKYVNYPLQKLTEQFASFMKDAP